MNAKCPHCGANYEVTESELGTKADCIECGRAFVVGQENVQGDTKKRLRINTFGSKYHPPMLSSQLEDDAAVVTPSPRCQLTQSKSKELTPSSNLTFGVFLKGWFKEMAKEVGIVTMVILSIGIAYGLRNGCSTKSNASRSHVTSAKVVPSFIGIRDLNDVFESIPDKDYLYEYSGSGGLRIQQVINSSPRGVRVTKRGTFKSIFIEMDVSNLAEDDPLPPIKVECNGVLRYKTVLGAENTIRAFKAVSKFKIISK